MARCPFARWLPVTSRPLEAFRSTPKGLTLHISSNRNDTLGGIRGTFMSSNKFPSHFGIERQGAVGQYLDTQYHDWAAERTVDYFSVECAATSGDQLSDAQIVSVSRLYAWLNETHNTFVRLANSHGDTGLAYHSLFKPTGHPLCPGTAVIAQRQWIVNVTNWMLRHQATPDAATLFSLSAP